MKTVQLKAMYIKQGDPTEAPTKAEADLFSLYMGEPGNFAWVADFADPEVAYLHAVTLQERLRVSDDDGCRLDTTQFDAVMNPKPEPTGHPHAELMAQYAEDAKTHREPWKLWEYQTSTGDSWNPLVDTPSWISHFKYRRKPVQAGPSGDPTHCPFCGGSDIVFVNGVDAIFNPDPGDSLPRTQALDEHQCRSETCGRSFWS